MIGRIPQRRLKLTERLACVGPRKLLAIDGGGILRRAFFDGSRQN